MKWASFSLFCLLIGSISCRSVGKPAASEEEIKQLILDGINKIEKDIKAKEPIKIKQLPLINYKNDKEKVDIDVIIINGEATGDVEPINVDVQLSSNELAIDSSILYKNGKLVADILVVGTVDGKDIEDKGKIEITIPDFEHVGKAKFKYSKNSIQIIKLVSKNHLKTPQVKLSGLTLSDKQKEKSEDALAKKFDKDIAHLDKKAQKSLPKIQKILNTHLKGKTLDDLLQIINKFVHHDSMIKNLGQHVSGLIL